MKTIKEQTYIRVIPEEGNVLFNTRLGLECGEAVLHPEHYHKDEWVERSK